VVIKNAIRDLGIYQRVCGPDAIPKNAPHFCLSRAAEIVHYSKFRENRMLSEQVEDYESGVTTWVTMNVPFRIPSMKPTIDIGASGEDG